MAKVEYMLKIDGLSERLRRRGDSSIANQTNGEFEVVWFEIHDGPRRLSGEEHLWRRLNIGIRRSNGSAALDAARRFAMSFEQAEFSVREAGQLRYTLTFTGFRVHTFQPESAEPVDGMDCSFHRMRYLNSNGHSYWAGSGVPAGDVERIYRREDWNRVQARTLLDRTGLA